jgi:hypothetical protein
MPKNVIFVLMYHRHKLLDLIDKNIHLLYLIRQPQSTAIEFSFRVWRHYLPASDMISPLSGLDVLYFTKLGKENSLVIRDEMSLMHKQNFVFSFYNHPTM